MRYAAKVDNNQASVVAVLRVMRPAWSVFLTHRLGAGFPDFVVGAEGRNFIFELKQSDKAPLTPMEKRFFKSWVGQADVVWNAEQVISIVEAGLENR